MQFVQIINEVEEKAVRFPFVDHARAKAFETALNAAFAEHQVEGTVGRYDEGAKCCRRAPVGTILDAG